MEEHEGTRVMVEALGARIREGIRQMLSLADALGTEGKETLNRITEGLLVEVQKAEDLVKVQGSRISCPSCGGSVMAQATLCGFCWRQLIPPPPA